MSTGKEIRVRFVVDEQSAQRVNRSLDDMIKRAQELAKTLQSVGGGGGIFGGGGVGGGRPQSNQSTMAQAAGTGTQKVSFASVLGQNVDVFKKMAQEGGVAMKAMTDALSRGATEQQTAVNKLTRELDGLNKMYDKVGGKASGAFGEKVQNLVLNKYKELQGARKELEKLRAMEGDFMPGPRDDMPPSPAKPGLFARMNSAVVGATGGEAGITGALGGFAKGAAGMAGVATIAAVAAKKVYDYYEKKPDEWLGLESNQGQMMGRRQLELRAGEDRNRLAEQAIYQDTDKRKDFADLNSGWRRAKSSIGAFLTGDFAGALTGQAADRATFERRSALIQMQRDSDPVKDAVMGQLQDYRGTIGSMRAMGLGVRPGMTGLDSLTKHRLAYSAFDDGEIAAAFQGISGSGTRTAAHSLQGYAMHGTAAGIGGAAQSIGTMAKFGGKSNAFANAMLQMAGGGKVDATTTGILSSFIASQQDRLGMNTGAGAGQYQGQGLMEMIARGTQGADGRLVAEQNMRGADYLQKAVAGQTSPYQSARNFMLAGEAAPGLNMYGQGFLASKMSLTELADATEGKGGDVSAIFKALGGDKGMAKDYFKGVSGSLLEGVSAQGLGDTDSGRLAKALSESGMDPRAFFKSGAYKKVKGFENDKTGDRAIAALGGALQASDDGLDASTAMGLARDLAGISQGPAAGKGKAGAGGYPEIEKAAAQAKIFADQLEKSGNEVVQWTNAIRSSRVEAEWMATHKTATEEQRSAVKQYLTSHPDATVQQIDAELDSRAEKARKSTEAREMDRAIRGGLRKD